MEELKTNKEAMDETASRLRLAGVSYRKLTAQRVRVSARRMLPIVIVHGASHLPPPDCPQYLDAGYFIAFA